MTKRLDASLSDLAQALRQSHAWAFYRIAAPAEDLPRVTRRVQLAWLEVARDIHERKVLEVDRERLARALAKWQHNDRDFWESFHEQVKESYLARADYVLSQVRGL